MCSTKLHHRYSSTGAETRVLQNVLKHNLQLSRMSVGADKVVIMTDWVVNVTDVTLFHYGFLQPMCEQTVVLYSGTNTSTLWTNSSTLTGTVVIDNTVQLTLRQKNQGERKKKRVLKKR